MSVSDCEAGMYGSNFAVADSREIKVDYLFIRVKIVGDDQTALA